jgi:hypothetical protein
MRIGIHLSRDSSNDILMRDQSRKSELRGCYPRNRSYSRSVSIRHIVLSHNLDLLLEDLPKFDRLVCETADRCVGDLETRDATDRRREEDEPLVLSRK